MRGFRSIKKIISSTAPRKRPRAGASELIVQRMKKKTNRPPIKLTGCKNPSCLNRSKFVSQKKNAVQLKCAKRLARFSHADTAFLQVISIFSSYFRLTICQKFEVNIKTHYFIPILERKRRYMPIFILY